jgi:hypothetical protein
VEVELLTGRMHQVRAQLAAINAPILADTLYTPLAGFTWDDACYDAARDIADGSAADETNSLTAISYSTLLTTNITSLTANVTSMTANGGSDARTNIADDRAYSSSSNSSCCEHGRGDDNGNTQTMCERNDETCAQHKRVKDALRRLEQGVPQRGYI